MISLLDVSRGQNALIENLMARISQRDLGFIFELQGVGNSTTITRICDFSHQWGGKSILYCLEPASTRVKFLELCGEGRENVEDKGQGKNT